MELTPLGFLEGSAMAEQKRLGERGWTKGSMIQPAVVQGKRAGTPRCYTLQVFLTDGPVTKAFAGKEISRAIQMRGGQTLSESKRSRACRPRAASPR